MNLDVCVKASVGGKVVYEKENDPWCVGFCGVFLGYRYAMQSLSIPDVGNTSRTWNVANASMAGPSGNASYGPVVGTGNTAHSFDDYNLGTKIAHGTGTGQLSYGVTNFNNPQNSGNDRYFEVYRTFTNSSGASITVYEIGMIMYNGSYYFLACRDVISGGIEIPNGQALTLTYKVKISL